MKFNQLLENLTTTASDINISTAVNGSDMPMCVVSSSIYALDSWRNPRVCNKDYLKSDLCFIETKSHSHVFYLFIVVKYTIKPA